MNAGQRAIATARVRLLSNQSAREAGTAANVSHARVVQANVVLRYAAELADQVLAGELKTDREGRACAWASWAPLDRRPAAALSGKLMQYLDATALLRARVQLLRLAGRPKGLPDPAAPLGTLGHRRRSRNAQPPPAHAALRANRGADCPSRNGVRPPAARREDRPTRSRRESSVDAIRARQATNLGPTEKDLPRCEGTVSKALPCLALPRPRHAAPSPSHASPRRASAAPGRAPPCGPTRLDSICNVVANQLA